MEFDRITSKRKNFPLIIPIRERLPRKIRNSVESYSFFPEKIRSNSGLEIGHLHENFERSGNWNSLLRLSSAQIWWTKPSEKPPVFKLKPRGFIPLTLVTGRAGKKPRHGLATPGCVNRQDRFSHPGAPLLFPIGRMEDTCTIKVIQRWGLYLETSCEGEGHVP